MSDTDPSYQLIDERGQRYTYVWWRSSGRITPYPESGGYSPRWNEKAGVDRMRYAPGYATCGAKETSYEKA